MAKQPVSGLEARLKAVGAQAADAWLGYLLRRRERMAHQELFYRHTGTVRALHWVNALCLVVMLMSGLQIFNAHPALYWGQIFDFDHPFVSLFGEQDNSGRIVKGVTQIGHLQFNTTGLFGASYEDGQLT